MTRSLTDLYLDKSKFDLRDCESINKTEDFVAVMCPKLCSSQMSMHKEGHPVMQLAI